MDRLFDKGGKLCPLNDFELNKFRYQLAQVSNLEDMRDAPMVRDDAGRLPDDSSHGAWKDRILGRENSLMNDSALPKKASNPEPWHEIPIRRLRTHHGRARSEEDAALQRSARRRRRPR